MEGASSEAKLSIEVEERPNRWYEEARLVALIHHPESMPLNQIDEFAQRMKRQGYAIGMVISYNNGGHRYRWPSVFEPNCPVGDLVGAYKTALERAGVRFGMYVGNLNGANHGGDDGAMLLIDDAIRRFRPDAFWFDWAGWHPPSPDALYSLIRSRCPEALVVLNGIPTICNGDWDVVCLEGWGAWGERHWDLWPFPFEWPKKPVIESWRLVADPEFEYSGGVWSDWREYVRLQIALIGEGFVANIDHSPTIRMGTKRRTPLARLEDSHVWQCHEQMTLWANPKGRPSLIESYTHVSPGPLRPADWGYTTLNVSRTVIYLHMVETPYGKKGLPATESLTVGPVRQKVRRVVWMNRDQELSFQQDGEKVAIALKGVHADQIDTILKVELDGPHPQVDPATLRAARDAIPPGNVASFKPSRLLSRDGKRTLVPSAFHFARYGVDGQPVTSAQGGHEWAWTYHVDLQDVYRVRRVVVRFGRVYATEYKVRLSADGEAWHTVAHVTGCKGGIREHRFEPVEARYIHVEAIKPDGPNQPGGQMSIAELEAYE